MKLVSNHPLMQWKNCFFVIVFCISPMLAFPLVIIKGRVLDKNSNEILAGASLQIENSYLANMSNGRGEYTFKKMKEGNYTFKISYIGYEIFSSSLLLKNDTSVDFYLTPKNILAEEVIVTATRADSKTPTSFTKVDKEEIAKQNLGQDLPYLLNLQPSVVTTSDAGAGVGYTGIRIRGTDATRINATINGIPVNDAESQSTYWVDIPDLVSSVDNIQIQRGVGTSSNGAGAFGGSINIETSKLNPEPYANIASSAGSFNTFKNTLNIGSGLLNDKFSFDGRMSKITSDGFIDRGKSDLKSYYLSGAYYGKNTTIKFITFSGNEKTYQCWNGVPESKLRGDAEGMLDYIERNYLSESDAQNLIHSNNRTYNSFTYQNQTDNYQQNNYQLHFSERIKNYWTLNAALHYTKGKGYYEEYKDAQSFANYNLQNVIIGADTISSSSLVRQKWLDNDFYGITYSANYNRNKKFSATIGGAYNIYDGDHYGKILWSQYNSNNTFDNKYYNDNALKKDFNVFVKANYQLTKNFNFFGDVQMRNVNYSFKGFDANFENKNQHVQLNFFNPKVGVTCFLTTNKIIYLSYAVANKEPSRDDYVQSSPASRTVSENLQNVEFGYVQKNKQFTYSFNTYYMKYKNQLVLNGKVNDVGNYNRVNVKDSYRLGIEWMNTIRIFKQLEWTANATWSTNKISNYKEFVDNYDSTAQRINTFKNSDIAFSPNLIFGSSLRYEPIKKISISFITKYVSAQFLDNTSNANRKLNSYVVNDVRLNYSLYFKHIKEIGFTLLLNNIFNEMYESNGYTYNYFSGGKMVVENFYYPQAGFNLMGGITLKF